MPIVNNKKTVAFGEIEINQDRRVSSLYMHADNYFQIQKYFKDHIDPCAHRQLLNKGIVGYLWAADIIVSRNIPKDIVLIKSDYPGGDLYAFKPNTIRFKRSPYKLVGLHPYTVVPA